MCPCICKTDSQSYLHSEFDTLCHREFARNQESTTASYDVVPWLFSRKTFRRRVLQKIVGVSHTTHIPHISSTPHISHTYPFQTYPTHIQHTTHIPHMSIPNVSHTYPTHIQHTTHIPHISIPNVSHTYPTHIQHPTHIPHISIPNVSHTYPTHIQHPTHIHSERIPPIPIQGLHEYEYHCMSFHILLLGGNGNENRNLAFPPMSIIACHFIHCYSAGMVMKIKTLLFLQLYGARMSMEFIVSYWLACLPVVCLCACFLIIFYYSIPPGGMGRVHRKATLSLKTWCRSPKTVAKRKFHLLAVNPLGKNVVSIAQNCSETQISFARGQPSR